MKHEHSSIIDAIGGNSVVAQACDVSSQAVSKWRKLGIPPARMMFLRLAFPAELAGMSTPSSRTAMDTPATSPTATIAPRPLVDRRIASEPPHVMIERRHDA